MGPKVAGQTEYKSQARPLDWFCVMCGGQNYSLRFDCFKSGCAALKPGFGGPGWREFFTHNIKEYETQKASVDHKLNEMRRGLTLLEKVQAEETQSIPALPRVSDSSKSDREQELLDELKSLRNEVKAIKQSRSSGKCVLTPADTPSKGKADLRSVHEMHKHRRERDRSSSRERSMEIVRPAKKARGSRSCEEEERRCRKLSLDSRRRHSSVRTL